jgi:hypothetical protein
MKMDEIKLSINGKEIPLTDFPRTIIVSTILGMLKSLKDVDVIKSVEIKIEKE